MKPHVCIYNDGCECTVRSRDKCNGCGWNPKEQRRRKAYDKDPIQFDPWRAREGLRELEIQRWRRSHGFVDPVEEVEREQEDPEVDPSEPEDET